VHLLALIVLFNGGVFWVLRAIRSRDGADSPGLSDSPEPSDPPELSDTRKRNWRTASVLLGSCVVVGGLYLGIRDRPPERPVDPPATVAVEPTAESPAEKPAAAVDPIATAPDGKALFMRTCVACHGMDAKGLPGLGKDMTTSAFIHSTGDEALVEFIKKGRAIDDPTNTTGVPMPPYGANPTLTDAEILAIIEFIRSLSD
jgi:disulfide bond formation protein DsbB